MVGWGARRTQASRGGGGGFGPTISLVQGKLAAFAARDEPSRLRIQSVMRKTPPASSPSPSPSPSPSLSPSPPPPPSSSSLLTQIITGGSWVFPFPWTTKIPSPFMGMGHEQSLGVLGFSPSPGQQRFLAPLWAWGTNNH